MANKAKIKVPINKDVLYSEIKRKTSISKIGPAIGYSEKTIRRGLVDGYLSIEIVALLGLELNIDPKVFADFDTYFKLVKLNISKKEEF